MRILLCGLLGYNAFVLQGSLAPEWALGRSTPQFLMLLCCIATLRLPDVPGLLNAAFLGLLSDALAPQGLGADVVCFTLAASAIHCIPWRRSLRSPLILCVINFICIFLMCCASTALRSASIGQLPNWPATIEFASGSAGLTALLGAALSIFGGVLWNLGPQILGVTLQSTVVGNEKN